MKEMEESKNVPNKKDNLERYEKQAFIIAFVLLIALPFIEMVVHEFGHIIVGYLLGGSVDAIQFSILGGGRVYINNLNEISRIITGFAGHIFGAFVFVGFGKVYKKFLLIVPICLLGSVFEGLISFIGREYHYITSNLIVFISMILVLVMVIEKLEFAYKELEGEEE